MPVIRGATTVNNNNSEEILTNTEIMLTEIIELNHIQIDDINSITFTMTNDLDKAYPAVAARKLKIVNAGLMCYAELFVEGSLRKCIRAMVDVKTNKTQKQMKHVYQNEAKKLRPDITNNKFKSIAIDGPCASGKGTVAKILSNIFEFVYIDTGAMYRSVALKVLQSGKNIDDKNDIISVLDEVNIVFKYENNEQKIYLNNVDVSKEIRSNEASQGASKVAVIKEVREKLVQMQQKIAQNTDVVMEGRDIGTVVIPNATLKIYLDATPKARAKRRAIEMEQKGEKFDLDFIVKEIEERDFRDKNRDESPLIQTEDAIYVDTSNLTIEESVAIIQVLFEKRTK